MKMIGHQHVRINPAAAFDFGPAKTFQKEAIIIVCKESSSAIVSALNYVVRISRDCDSRRSCHPLSRCQQICGAAYSRITTSSSKKVL
jgi:hypothetical protein